MTSLFIYGYLIPTAICLPIAVVLFVNDLKYDIKHRYDPQIAPKATYGIALSIFIMSVMPAANIVLLTGLLLNFIRDYEAVGIISKKGK